MNLQSNKIAPESIKIGIKEEFPDFLFKNADVDFFKNLILTEEECEFLGIERLYTDFCQKFNKNNIPETVECFFPNVPYEYVKEIGAFKLINMQKRINRKLGKHKNSIVEYLEENPDNIFDIKNLTSKEIFDKFSNWDEEKIKLLYSIFLRKEKKIIETRWDFDTYGCPYTIISDDYLKKIIFLNNKTFCIEDEYSDYIRITENEDNTDKAYVILTEKGKKLIEWYQKEYLES